MADGLHLVTIFPRGTAAQCLTVCNRCRCSMRRHISLTRQGNSNELDLGDPTQHSRNLIFRLKRKRSFQRDIPNKRQSMSSSNAGRYLDNTAHLDGRLTLIDPVANPSTGGSADAGLENSWPEAGRSV